METSHKSSYMSGISVIHCPYNSHDVNYKSSAATLSFSGWISLGCCSGSSHFCVMTSRSVLFVVDTEEPPRFAKLRGIKCKGYSRAFPKSIIVFHFWPNMQASSNNISIQFNNFCPCACLSFNELVCIAEK